MNTATHPARDDIDSFRAYARAACLWSMFIHTHTECLSASRLWNQTRWGEQKLREQHEHARTLSLFFIYSIRSGMECWQGKFGLFLLISALPVGYFNHFFECAHHLRPHMVGLYNNAECRINTHRKCRITSCGVVVAEASSFSYDR